MKEKFKKAYIEITNVCNKNCSFCHKTQRKKEYMTREGFERVLCEVAPLTKYIYFHLMGEPTLHPELPLFLSMASERGFFVTLTTNGTRDLSEIIDTGLYKLVFSLHSFEDDYESSHAKYLEKVVSSARCASEKGILVSLRLWSVHSDKRRFEFAESYILNAFNKKRGESKLDEGVFLSYAERFEWPDLKNEEQNPEFCYGLRDQFGILVDGTVVPCCLDAEGDLALGNVFQTPLSDILARERAKALYDGFSQRKAVFDLCKRCPYATRFNKASR